MSVSFPVELATPLKVDSLYRKISKQFDLHDSFYLEISGRDTGKTSRLLRRALRYLGEGKKVLIVTQHQIFNCISYLSDHAPEFNVKDFNNLSVVRGLSFLEEIRGMNLLNLGNSSEILFDEFCSSVVSYKDLLQAGIDPMLCYWSSTPSVICSINNLKTLDEDKLSSEPIIKWFLHQNLEKVKIPIISFKNFDPMIIKDNERGVYIKGVYIK